MTNLLNSKFPNLCLSLEAISKYYTVVVWKIAINIDSDLRSVKNVLNNHVIKMLSQLPEYASPPTALVPKGNVATLRITLPIHGLSVRAAEWAQVKLQLLFFSSGSILYISACLRHDINEEMEDKLT